MHNYGASMMVIGFPGNGEIVSGDNQIIAGDNQGRMLRCVIFVHKKSRQHYAGGHECI